MSNGEPRPTRRQVMKAAAVGTGAVVVGTGANRVGLSPARRADGAAFTVAATGFLVGYTATSMYLERNSGTSAESAAQDAAKTDLQNDLYESAIKRQSENDSRFLSTTDIANLSRDTAYEEGKIAAFEPLANGKAESEVVSTGQSAVDEYFAIPKKNLIDQWNESIYEVFSYRNEVANQGFSLTDFFQSPASSKDNSDDYESNQGFHRMEQSETTIDINGEDYTVQRILVADAIEDWTSDLKYQWDPTSKFQNTNAWSWDEGAHLKVTAGEGLEYLSYSDWSSIWNKLNTIQDEVRSGLATWVNTVYGNLQAGNITISEVASNLDLAKRALEEESLPRATADLVSMNLPVDLKRKVTITYSRDGINWTASGYFAALGDSPPTWTVGETYDPTTDSVPTVILSTDGNSIQGDWSDFNAPMDGGNIAFTREPFANLVYQVRTIEQETATVKASAFSEDTSNNVWTADLSGQLENPITEAESVAVYPDTEESYQEVLREPFTIQQIVNEETGENVNQGETTRKKEPQRDDNYLTQEDWDRLSEQRQQQYEELLEKFEEVEGSSGGGPIFPGSPFADLGERARLAVLGVAGFFGVTALLNAVSG